MKKHILKRLGMMTLLIAVVTLSGHASSYYHSCAGIKDLNPVQIICKLDYSGKYLELHRKYNFSYDEQNRVTKKAAYKWNVRDRKWIPDYILTFAYASNKIETHYAKWNKRKKSYDPAKEKVVYKTGESGISSYTSYKRVAIDKEWEIVTDLSNLLPNRLIAEK